MTESSKQFIKANDLHDWYDEMHVSIDNICFLFKREGHCFARLKQPIALTQTMRGGIYDVELDELTYEQTKKIVKN